MDGVTLLDQARAAGLAVAVRGDRLIVRGPRRAETVAKLLLANKPAVMAALVNHKAPPVCSRANGAGEWLARHREALACWGAFHPPEEAAEIAWGEMVNRWHKRHGERVPPGICAGCRRPIGNSAVLPLGGGAGVHTATLECIVAYGDHWRSAATEALVAMGLTPPRMQIDPSLKDTP